MQYHFKIEKQDASFFAQCYEIPKCTAKAKNFQSLEDEMRKSLSSIFHNSSPGEIPLPELNVDLYRGFSVATVPLDQELVFSLLLRHERLKNNYTQQYMATQMGFKNVCSYQTLEKNANPSLNTVYKILKILPNFPLNLLLGNTIMHRSAAKIKFSDV